jgi:hypothetical protein
LFLYVFGCGPCAVEGSGCTKKSSATLFLGSLSWARHVAGSASRTLLRFSTHPRCAAAEKARLPAACRNQVRCSAFVRLSRVLACLRALKAKSGFGSERFGVWRRQELLSSLSLIQITQFSFFTASLYLYIAGPHCQRDDPSLPAICPRGIFSLLLSQKKKQWTCGVCPAFLLLVAKSPFAVLKYMGDYIFLKGMFTNRATMGDINTCKLSFGFLRLHRVCMLEKIVWCKSPRR